MVNSTFVTQSYVDVHQKPQKPQKLEGFSGVNATQLIGISEIVKGLAKPFKIKWKLHIAYRPQSSWTLKTTLAKLYQETQSPWVELLLLALLRACYTLRTSGYSPLEILYGRPPPVISRLGTDLKQTGDLEVSRHLQALEKL